MSVKFGLRLGQPGGATAQIARSRDQVERREARRRRDAEEISWLMIWTM